MAERSVANPQGTYNVRALREEILAARKQGATDADLLAELKEHPVLGPKIDGMLARGINPTQAINNVAVILKEEKYDPTEGETGPTNFVAGLGMSADKAVRGAKQFFGSPFVSQETREKWAKENAEADRLNAPLRNNKYGMAGEILGDVGTTALPGIGATGAALKFIPKVGQSLGTLNLLARGGRALVGAAAGGAGAQVVTPESAPLDSAEDYLRKAGRGAAEGVVGDVAGRAVGRVIKPLRFMIPQAHRERLARLLDANIGKDTPINNRSGAFDLAQLTDDRTAIDLKSSMSKLPFVSSSMQQRANAQLGDFTESVMSRTGTGKRTASPEALHEAHKNLTARSDAFKSMDPIPLGPNYQAATRKALAEQGHPLAGTPAADLEPLRQARDFARGNRTTVPAEKALETRGILSDKAHAGFQGDNISKARAYEAAQKNLDDAIRESFDAQSPGSGKAWDAYRKNMGNYLDIASAAGSANGRMPGDFLNPKALAGQARNTQGKARYAAGEAGELAQIADDATRVLTDQVPNSGTPQRALYSLALLGGLSKLASSDSTLLKVGAHLTGGPIIAKHALSGKGPFGAKHLAHGLFGEKMSGEALKVLEHTSPAFAAAFIERLRQQEEGEQ